MHQEKGNVSKTFLKTPDTILLRIERIKAITRENRKMIDRIVECSSKRDKSANLSLEQYPSSAQNINSV